MTLEALLKMRNAKNGFANDIGIVLTKLEEGYAEGEILLEPRHMNPRGAVHGGCIFSLMDTVGGVAAMSYGNFVTTSSSDVHFLRPAVGLRKLRAVAKEIKAGRSLMVYDVEVLGDDGALLANSTFTFFRLEDVIKPAGE